MLGPPLALVVAQTIEHSVQEGIIGAMDLLIEAVRWFNYHFPWHQPKPSLAKRVARRLNRSRGRTVYGGIHGRLRMRLDISVDLERDIYLNSSNLAMLSLFRRFLRPGDVVIDGGANLGFLSLVAWQCVGSTGKVYAFEPQPTALAWLRENVALNRAASIAVMPQALWHQSGKAQLYEFLDAGHDLASLGKRADKGVAREVSVETVRLDDTVREPVRLYKLDIEGAEWSALQGSQRLLFSDPAPHVLIELNPRTCQAFGHGPLEVVDWFLARAPRRRLHLVRRRRHHGVDRNDLARLFEHKENKSHNVWFEPVNDQRGDR